MIFIKKTSIFKITVGTANIIFSKNGGRR